MKLLPPDLVPSHFPQIPPIDEDLRSVYRLIVFSPDLQATQLLHRFFEAIQHLRHVLEFKNAQQEAHTEAEARQYLEHLHKAMHLMVEEIGQQRCLQTAVDLFRLFRAVAPEAATRHPNRYRQTIVQVGSYLPPEPREVPGLVDELLARLPEIPHPVIRAIYLHHELVRIHPFVDGNGRVGRMAKNWLMMYHLYPPIFIYGREDRTRYIRVSEQSFRDIEQDPGTFHASTQSFFEAEMRRVKASIAFLLARLLRDAAQPFGAEDEEIQPYARD